MEIIAVSNIKGGVGKTTTAVNLACLAAASGCSTVLWDLDPQGAATYTLRGAPNERASARKLVSSKRELPELVATTDYARLDLLPADFSYRQLDVHMSERKHPTERLLPFFSVVDRRKSQHEEIIAATRQRLPMMLATEVPYWSEIERMAVRRVPIPAYAPRNPAALVHSSLWSEIAARLRG